MGVPKTGELFRAILGGAFTNAAQVRSKKPVKGKAVSQQVSARRQDHRFLLAGAAGSMATPVISSRNPACTQADILNHRLLGGRNASPYDHIFLNYDARDLPCPFVRGNSSQSSSNNSGRRFRHPRGAGRIRQHRR